MQRELAAEFIGTFTLVSAVCGAALFSAPSAGLMAVAFAGLSALAMCRFDRLWSPNRGGNLPFLRRLAYGKGVRLRRKNCLFKAAVPKPKQWLLPKLKRHEQRVGRLMDTA
jgi:hypothetical protein